MLKKGKRKTIDIHRNYIRHAFTLLSIFEKSESQKYIKNPLDEFFKNINWWTMTQVMIDKTRYFNYLINYMQKRLKEKCATIDAKVAVIKIQWEKTLV